MVLIFPRKKNTPNGLKTVGATHLKLEAREQPSWAGEQQQEPIHRELVDQDEHAHQARLRFCGSLWSVVVAVVVVLVVVGGGWLISLLVAEAVTE